MRRAATALNLTILWVLISATVAMVIYSTVGTEAASQFCSAYLIEKSLSMDNLFVFYLIFKYFGVPVKQQARFLSWGIIGAFILRSILLASGVALISHFQWLMYGFGLFLIFSSIKIVKSEEDATASDSAIVCWCERHLSMFWMVLVSIEISDLLFALDSIPASFAISHTAWILILANMLAVCGLRSFYFVIANLVDHLDYLKYGIALVLVLIGGKMLCANICQLPDLFWLSCIAGILIVSVICSLIKTERKSSC